MQIRNSLRSLYFPRAASPAKRTRSRSKPAPTSITRIQAGMPQARPAPDQANTARRRRRTHAGYSSASYVSHPHRTAGISPRMFRIG
ncbi:hypothetical protein [Luteimonas granuli]|uniref:Uncharacterized protein n=1 Tax=Luteimonas granuli TaxID=1176533 RepID=A0A518N2K1_9GAMM|nr:hypothetical protein [Luteimonas granuli]QDW66124.1 hypothetical protein FPZ22_03825 [Luteimonas granuli]